MTPACQNADANTPYSAAIVPGLPALPGPAAPMNILLCSVPFAPSLGGIETVSALLAAQFVRAGHAVTVVTQTPGGPGPEPEAPHALLRRPTAAQLRAQVRAADVVFHNNISLRFAWPGLGLDRPWVVAHHTWLAPGLRGALKRSVLPLARHVAASHALAAALPVASVVIPNPYCDDVFRPGAGVARERDVVFVGRLVSDKGVPLLLQALAMLGERGRALTATLVGDGPEAGALRAQVRRLGLEDRVRFTGALAPQALAPVLQAHRVLVVPSVWEEPFGVVVLEALACGCMPVVARSGGLPEAAGPCGRVFERGNAGALADVLADTLAASQHSPRAWHEPAAAHLARHTPARVAASYLKVLADACHRSAACPA